MDLIEASPSQQRSRFSSHWCRPCASSCCRPSPSLSSGRSPRFRASCPEKNDRFMYSPKSRGVSAITGVKNDAFDVVKSHKRLVKLQWQILSMIINYDSRFVLFYSSPCDAQCRNLRAQSIFKIRFKLATLRLLKILLKLFHAHYFEFWNSRILFFVKPFTRVTLPLQQWSCGLDRLEGLEFEASK